MDEKLSRRKTYYTTSVILEDDLKTRVDTLGAQLGRTRSYIVDFAIRRALPQMEQEANALAEERRVA